jgi:pimeloyl-ACP methyl ester carboxylesterase
MSSAFEHEKVLSALLQDKEFNYLARNWSATVRLERNGSAHDLTIVDGKVTGFAPSTSDDWQVRLSGTELGWSQLINGDPAAFMALHVGSDDLQLEADLVTQRAPYGAAVRRLIKVLRAVEGKLPAEIELTTDPFAETDVAVGRYVRFEVDGVQYRVYYEEAGTGVPLLLQHTAGADSRQWRNVLADPELQQQYRMIAYDLPFHGRSLPPVLGSRWWEEAYEPGREQLFKWIVAFKRALDLDRPLIMGVSVGGQVAADILAFHPDDFGGGIAMNGTYHNDALAFLDNSPFNDPRIGRDFYSALMYESTSPVATESLRRESQWIYSSNGPGVYKGDNLFYSSQDHDLRVYGDRIDTSRTPLYAVVGEFDGVNGMPGGPQEIPANIPGARFAVLPALSHFAMSDDPVRFNEAIKPILEQVVADSHFSAALTSGVSR